MNRSFLGEVWELRGEQLVEKKPGTIRLRQPHQSVAQLATILEVVSESCW